MPNFHWDGERTMVRDIHVRHQSGELVGRLLDAPNDFRIDLASTIDANALRSLAPAEIREFVNDWDWPHAANIQLSIRGSAPLPRLGKAMGSYNCSAGVFAPSVLIAPRPAFISGMARSPTRIFE